MDGQTAAAWLVYGMAAIAVIGVIVITFMAHKKNQGIGIGSMRHPGIGDRVLMLGTIAMVVVTILAWDKGTHVIVVFRPAGCASLEAAGIKTYPVMAPGSLCQVAGVRKFGKLVIDDRQVMADQEVVAIMEAKPAR